MSFDSDPIRSSGAIFPDLFPDNTVYTLRNSIKLENDWIVVGDYSDHTYSEPAYLDEKSLWPSHEPVREEPKESLRAPAGKSLPLMKALMAPKSEDRDESHSEVSEYCQNESADESVSEIQVKQKIRAGKLPSSKTPIMDALAYCALNNLGASIVKNEGAIIEFKVKNWDTLLKNCRKFDSKLNPTTDYGSRLKTYKRWFTDIPRLPKAGMKKVAACTIAVRTDTSDDKVAKMRDILERMRAY